MVVARGVVGGVVSGCGSKCTITTIIIPWDFEPTEIMLSYKQFYCNESELEANR